MIYALLLTTLYFSNGSNDNHITAPVVVGHYSTLKQCESVAKDVGKTTYFHFSDQEYYDKKRIIAQCIPVELK